MRTEDPPPPLYKDVYLLAGGALNEVQFGLADSVEPARVRAELGRFWCRTGAGNTCQMLHKEAECIPVCGCSRSGRGSVVCRIQIHRFSKSCGFGVVVGGLEVPHVRHGSRPRLPVEARGPAGLWVQTFV